MRDRLLAALLRLPAELQYRIVGRSLVRSDHHANRIDRRSSAGSTHHVRFGKENEVRAIVRQTAFLSAMLLAAALQAQSPLPPGTWRIADAPPELQYPISRANLIVVSMQDALLRELTTALELGGPEFALKSCHVDVVGITRRIGRQEGVTAGRTSDRLRSSANAPKAWAAPLVAGYAGRRTHDVDGFAVDLGDKVGVLRPIAEQPICAPCHGPAEKVSPAVREALGSRYPRDRATGFSEGEIRGWFWVEVPKTRP